MTNPPLQLVESLCHALERDDIVYCHFKSNEALAKSANGENDLDLLIDRASAARFAEILHQLGFKPAHLPPIKALPGVNDWYGLDPASVRLVHVHAHYQLIVGDDMTKNVRLPIERAFLDSVTKDELFRVPSPEMEFVVFVVRMMLKHAPLDATLMAQGSLGGSEQRELAWLEARIDESVVAGILAEHLPFLDPALFADCRAAIAGGVSPITKARVARRLDTSLRAQARRGVSVNASLKVTRRFRHAFVRKVLRRKTRKRLDIGGALIAVVGGDGSGKSSVVKDLTTGFGRDLDTRRFHLGKPPRSLGSHVLRSIMRAGRLVGLFAATRLPAAETGPDAPYPGHAWALWHTLNGRDRCRTYAEARRFATGGGISVCDRYPLDLIAMDGPRLASVATMPGAGKLAHRLAAAETAAYRQITPPDVLLVMRVHPDRAVARRPEQDPEFVATRNAEVFGADWSAVPSFVIDAEQELDQVIQSVRRAVWDSV